MRWTGMLFTLLLVTGCAGATTNLAASNPNLRPRVYAAPYDVVWNQAVRAATHIKSWAVTSSDKDSGVIALRKGFNLWTTGTMMTVHVQALSENRTQVEMQSALSGFNGVLTLDYGQNKRNLERYLQELDQVMMNPENIFVRSDAS